jgi:hypothetical protein
MFRLVKGMYEFVFLINGECCGEVCVERLYVQPNGCYHGNLHCQAAVPPVHQTVTQVVVTVSCYEVSALIAVRHYSFVILT